MVEMPKNALLSVFDKTGIADFAKALVGMGWSLFSSGGTATVLRESGLTVTDIGDIVGPPILGHRVVTLSREIHAGLLAQDTPEDLAELARIKAPWLELVCVDLYPLEEATRKAGATIGSVIEKTDIGGPALLRSAAKGRRLVISDVDLRGVVLRKLSWGGAHDPKFRHLLAMYAEQRVANYCETSWRYLSSYLEKNKEDGTRHTHVVEPDEAVARSTGPLPHH